MTQATDPTIALPLRVMPNAIACWWEVLHLTREATEHAIRYAYALASIAMLKRHAAEVSNGDQQFERARLDIAYVEALRARHQKWMQP